MNNDLSVPINSLLGQLTELLRQLTDEQYQRPIAILSDATLGQHTRHILEFFIELARGYDRGQVNYDGRQRDRRIETARRFAIETIQEIAGRLNKPDKEIMLIVDLQQLHIGTSRRDSRVLSNYRRELVYTLEHTVHHMALLRVGVRGIDGPALPESFGVAASTLQYRATCAR